MHSPPEVESSAPSQSSDAPLWHAIPAARCLELAGSTSAGLSATEAAARLQRTGENRLPGRKRTTALGLFLNQFRSPLIYLLLGAALVSLASGHALDAGFIGVVLLANALVGSLQEHRADSSMAALDRLIRHRARVHRDGRVAEIDAGQIVPGDIVEVESGMAVPADLRLLASQTLEVDEAMLSGESLPVRKEAGRVLADDTGLADRVTMLHAGTAVVQGRGTGLTVATGLSTQLGLIQSSLSGSQSAPPPLVLRLRWLSRQIAFGAVALILVLALVLGLQGETLASILLLAVALAVSAIPEGLPIAVTVALAAATRRMAARNVIVRSLPAVEGLGSCTLIASDKTGTLTLNRLSLEQVLLPEGRLVSRHEWHGDDNSALGRLAAAAAFCNEATTGPDAMLIGDTVDVALAEFARNFRGKVSGEADCVLLEELPYEPANRFSAVVVDKGGGHIIYAKGAAEEILAMCGDIPGRLVDQAHALACRGYRVLALAAGPAPRSGIDFHHLEGLELLGWVGLLDPVRPEAAAAIARCREAGIGVRMITGDHPATARTIATQLGLDCAPDQVVTGAEMAALADDPSRLAQLVGGGRVFARIEPNQKLQIVTLLSASGELVAVTGDGVNDAPALQAAHIGVAMGRGGTDVARGASDLVLTDDNFASIVAGIEEGRITYANVRKIVIFLLATGIAEIAMFLGALAVGLPMPLTAVQLLWLNLVTNGVQDVMLGFGRGEGDELRRLPRRPDEPLLDRSALILMVPPALVMTLLALAMMDWAGGRGLAQEEVRNAVLLLVVLFQNAYVLCMRSERQPLWRVPFATNPWLPLGVALALGLQCLAMYWAPLQAVLGTGPVDGRILIYCLAAALITIVVTEATKRGLRSDIRDNPYHSPG